MDSISIENGLIGGKRFFRGSKHMIIFKREKQALLKFKQYIEGEVEFDTFWAEYISCGDLMKYLCKFDKRRNRLELTKDFVDRFYNGKSIFQLKVGLQESVISYLEKKKIQFTNNTKEYVLWKKWHDYIPGFIPYDDSIYDFLENLDYGKRHSKKFYRDYFSKIYKYVKYPPRWMHFSEWPLDDDGSPTTFLYQTGFPNSHDFIEYWFSKKDGTKIKIEQYD